VCLIISRRNRRSSQTNRKKETSDYSALVCGRSANCNEPVICNTMEGTIRANIKKGSHVLIVLKIDQRTGKLTEGVVKDLLTSAPKHHRGIKVRLEDGQIGRVQKILE